eukprot:Colp12_sorted_trinity150504_noHs@33563
MLYCEITVLISLITPGVFVWMLRIRNLPSSRGGRVISGKLTAPRVGPLLMKAISLEATNVVLGLFCGATDVGGEDGVGAVLKNGLEVLRVAIGFTGEHIESATSKMALLKSLSSSLNIDNIAAGQVEKVAALLHLEDASAAHEVAGLVSSRDVQTDKVGGLEKFIEGFDVLSGTHRELGDNIVVDDLQADSLSKNGKLATDMAITDDAKHLATHLKAVAGNLVPATNMDLSVAVTELTSQHDNFSQSHLSDGTGVCIRSVKNGDTLRGSEREIGLVGTDAECTDREETVSSLENLLCELGLRTHTNDVDLLDLLHKFLLIHGLLFNHGKTVLAEHVSSRLMDVFQKENSDAAFGEGHDGGAGTIAAREILVGHLHVRVKALSLRLIGKSAEEAATHTRGGVLRHG